MTRDAVPRLLVVDDEPVVLESCRRVLEAEGMAVSSAPDAATAQRLLTEDGPFDLMVCDIKMPGMDGFQLIRESRRQCKGMAVLVMTGYLTAETVAAGDVSGAAGFVAKPFTPEELLAAVWKTLDRRFHGGEQEA